MKTEFNKQKYRPSTELERVKCEKIRNMGRARNYEKIKATGELPSMLIKQAI